MSPNGVRLPQAEIAEWHRREFPSSDPAETQLMAQVLVLAEEVGEVARCVVKARQGIRGGADHWKAELVKEMGDVVIALCAAADMADIDLSAAVSDRWAVVGQRKFATA